MNYSNEDEMIYIFFHILYCASFSYRDKKVGK